MVQVLDVTRQLTVLLQERTVVMISLFVGLLMGALETLDRLAVSVPTPQGQELATKLALKLREVSLLQVDVHCGG
jgi:hypothetical protein